MAYTREYLLKVKDTRKVTHLFVSECQVKLLNARLDGVPARQSVSNCDIAGQPEVFWLEDLVCAWVVEDGFSVDTGLVGECAITAVRLQR